MKTRRITFDGATSHRAVEIGFGLAVGLCGEQGPASPAGRRAQPCPRCEQIAEQPLHIHDLGLPRDLRALTGEQRAALLAYYASLPEPELVRRIDLLDEQIHLAEVRLRKDVRDPVLEAGCASASVAAGLMRDALIPKRQAILDQAARKRTPS